MSTPYSSNQPIPSSGIFHLKIHSGKPPTSIRWENNQTLYDAVEQTLHNYKFNKQWYLKDEYGASISDCISARDYLMNRGNNSSTTIRLMPGRGKTNRNTASGRSFDAPYTTNIPISTTSNTAFSSPSLSYSTVQSQYHPQFPSLISNIPHFAVPQPIPTNSNSNATYPFAAMSDNINPSNLTATTQIPQSGAFMPHSLPQYTAGLFVPSATTANPTYPSSNYSNVHNNNNTNSGNVNNTTTNTTTNSNNTSNSNNKTTTNSHNGNHSNNSSGNHSNNTSNTTNSNNNSIWNNINANPDLSKWWMNLQLQFQRKKQGNANPTVEMQQFAEALLSMDGKASGSLPVDWLKKGVLASKAVVKIKIGAHLTSNGQMFRGGIGSGFMISPNLLITNNHVINSQVRVENATIIFDYEADSKLPVREAKLNKEFKLVTSVELDYAIVAIDFKSFIEQKSDGSSTDKKVSPSKVRQSIEYLPLLNDERYLRIDKFYRLFVLQHPSGRTKEVSVHGNQVKIPAKYRNTQFAGGERYKTRLWHNNDTEFASSGSPICNIGWIAVALHHEAVPRHHPTGHILIKNEFAQQLGTDKYDENNPTHKTYMIDFQANEGIKIVSICADILKLMFQMVDSDVDRLNNIQFKLLKELIDQCPNMYSQMCEKLNQQLDPKFYPLNDIGSIVYPDLDNTEVEVFVKEEGKTSEELDMIQSNDDTEVESTDEVGMERQEQEIISNNGYTSADDDDTSETPHLAKKPRLNLERQRG